MLFGQWHVCLAQGKSGRSEQGVPSSVKKALDAFLPQQPCPAETTPPIGCCFAGPKYLVIIVECRQRVARWGVGHTIGGA
jgi:hypothetical protein